MNFKKIRTQGGKSIETPNNQLDRNRRCTDSLRAADNRTDPLQRLPAVAVVIILQHLDDRDLLNARLVCKSWNFQITTSRNRLWMERCERKRQFCFDENADLADMFRDYLSFHHVYHRIGTGQAFQAEEHSKPLDCYLAGRGFLPPEDTEFGDFFSGHNYLCVLDNFMVVVGFRDKTLMMADLKTQKVKWRIKIGGLIPMKCKQQNPYIVCLTVDGNLVLITLEGERRPQIYCYCKLKNIKAKSSSYAIHASGRFILFKGYIQKHLSLVYLVDVESQTTRELQLNGPDPTSVGFPYVHEMGFLAEDSLGEGQLAVGVISLSSSYLVAAVIDAQGKVLHRDGMRATFQCPKRQKQCFSWCENLFESRDACFVVRAGDSVEKYRVHCEASGVQFKLEWSKPMPADLLGSDFLVFGDQFALARRGHYLTIFRLDSGEPVVDHPNIFTGPEWIMMPDQMSPSFEYYAVKTLDKVFTVMIRHRTRKVVQFTNLRWLNGLSAANTKPDIPILIRFASVNSFRCVRWRGDVWKRLQGDGDLRKRLQGDGDVRKRLWGDCDERKSLQGDGDLRKRLQGDGDVRKRLWGDCDERKRLQGDGDERKRLQGDGDERKRLQGDGDVQKRLQGDGGLRKRLQGDGYERKRVLGDEDVWKEDIDVRKKLRGEIDVTKRLQENEDVQKQLLDVDAWKKYLRDVDEWKKHLRDVDEWKKRVLGDEDVLKRLQGDGDVWKEDSDVRKKLRREIDVPKRLQGDEDVWKKHLRDVDEWKKHLRELNAWQGDQDVRKKQFRDDDVRKRQLRVRDLDVLRGDDAWNWKGLPGDEDVLQRDRDVWRRLLRGEEEEEDGDSS